MRPGWEAPNPDKWNDEQFRANVGQPPRFDTPAAAAGLGGRLGEIFAALGVGHALVTAPETGTMIKAGGAALARGEAPPLTTWQKIKHVAVYVVGIGVVVLVALRRFGGIPVRGGARQAQAREVEYLTADGAILDRRGKPAKVARFAHPVAA